MFRSVCASGNLLSLVKAFAQRGSNCTRERVGEASAILRIDPAPKSPKIEFPFSCAAGQLNGNRF